MLLNASTVHSHRARGYSRVTLAASQTSFTSYLKNPHPATKGRLHVRKVSIRHYVDHVQSSISQSSNPPNPPTRGSRLSSPMGFTFGITHSRQSGDMGLVRRCWIISIILILGCHGKLKQDVYINTGSHPILPAVELSTNQRPRPATPSNEDEFNFFPSRILQRGGHCSLVPLQSPSWLL